MATFQEEILRQTGVNLGDGRRYQRGSITSAADAARTDATLARNAALDTVAQGQSIAPRSAAPVIPDAQLGALNSQPGAAKSPLGDSPVAKAVLAALPAMGAQAPGAPIDVNAYSGSRYGDSAATPLPGQPAVPGAPQAGYGATRGDPGINVTGYAGSRYDPLFAANNPQAPLDAPEIALAKQLLAMNSGRVPGRFYDAGNLAKATPQQIAIEAALLPQRQQQATTDTEGAALQEAFNLLRNGGATPGEAPALDDVTAALGRTPGTPAPARTVAPDIAAAVAAYVGKGGRDPKRIEEIRQTGEAAAKAAGPGKPVPGSAGYSTTTLPDGGTIVRDNATGEPVSNASINRPSPAPAEGKAITAGELKQISALEQSKRDLDALEKQFAQYNDPNFGGPVGGRVSNLFSVGPDPKVNAIENLVSGATPNLARGVFGEVGVLTDDDVKRYRALVPNAYDTKDIREQKFKDLRSRLASSIESNLSSLEAAGRDVGELKKRLLGGSAATKPALNGNDPAIRAAIMEALAARKTVKGTSTTK